jgi:hypothetical protein
MDCFRHLLALYGALAVCSMLSLYLWLSATIQRQREARRHGGRLREMEGELAEARASLAALEDAVREIGEASGALVAPAPARSGLNLTARSQVVRRHRYGEPPEAIAQSLGLPRAEVDLLIKVNRIVVESL